MTNGSNEISTRSGDNKGFIHAVMNEEIASVEYYLSIGMDVNFMDPEIMTSPMIESVKVNNKAIVNMLLAHGGDPRRVSQLGESAAKIASIQKDQEMLTLLGVKGSYRSRFMSFWKKIFS